MNKTCMEPITPTLFVCKRHCATNLNKKVLTRYKNAIKLKKKIIYNLKTNYSGSY